jgi:VIT1/CCC1 family predicted Fe2+/Mn2+ transporter
MTDTSAIIVIIMGLGMIAVGLTVKQFYAAKGMYGAALSDKKIPRWAGRVLFIGIGTVFILVGVAHLCGYN